MVLQLHGQIHKFLIALRQILGQAGDRLRRAHAGYDVLALGVDQILAVDPLLAGRGVTRKGHAGTGRIAHVAEYHRLYVDRRAPVAGDIVHAAVYDGAGVVPGTEHGLDRFHQLHPRLLRELLALHRVLIDSLKAGDQLLHVLGRQLRIELHALGFLHLVDDLLKERLRHLHNHVGEHLDKSAVGIIGKTGVAGLFGKALHRHIVQAQVEDRVHHTGHGSTGARTHRHQQRIVVVAEFLALDPFQHF